MTEKELFKCVADYVTCKYHNCDECLAFQHLIDQNGKQYYPCQLFNIIQFGELVEREDEN